MIIKNQNKTLLYSDQAAPWFITGLTDAEGCFYTSITKNTQFKTGWKVLAFFEIHIHKKDVDLLNYVQEQLGGIGRVVPNGKNAYSFRVNSLKDVLNNVVPHFDNYPLISQKLADYLLWKKVLIMMQNGEHLTDAGIKEIVNIRATINTGLSSVLKAGFPEATPVSRPLVEKQLIQHEAWFSGFTSGEGSFLIRVGKSLTKSGFRVQLVFTISQHIRDEKLLKSFIDYLGCGSYRTYFNRKLGDYICMNFEDIYGKIIPFFKKHPILGVKSQDFADWIKVAEYIQNKDHLTQEGLNKILEIKSNMNRGR